MAGTIVNNMLEADDADQVTGWSGGTLYSTGFQREGAGCLGGKISEGASEAYFTKATGSWDFSTETVLGWAMIWNLADTISNGGFGLVVGDGTNRAGFPCAGSDYAGKANHPIGWNGLILSVPDKDDAAAINLAGTTASINDAAITQVGYYLNVTGKALGNIDNAFWDIVWYYDHTGYALEITAGTSGSPATFSDLETYCASVAASRGIPGLYQVAEGVFQQLVPIQVGDDGTGSSYFSSSNEEIIFEDILNLNNHKFAAVGNSTGTNEAYFTNATFRNSSTEVTPTLFFNGGNFNTLEFAGTTIIDCVVNFSSAADATGHEYSAGNFINCGAIDMGSISDATNNIYNNCAAVTNKGAVMNGSTFLGSSVAANASALVYNETANPGGEIDNISFTRHATVLHHAIEFGLSSPTTISLTGQTFTGFSASNNVNDSALHIKRTSGTVTINASGVTGTISYRTDGATVVVNNNVTGTFTPLVAGTEVRIYTAGTSTELDGVESSGTSFAASIAASTSVDYVIHKVGYENIRKNSFTWPSTNQNINVTQRIDRNDISTP